MHRKLFVIALSFGLLALLLSAHDASKHKGKATEGEIVSMGADRMELKTASGPLTVTFTDKTKFEHGDQAVAKDHLQKGNHVSVFGTKLPTGELVAREVLVGASGGHQGHSPKK